MELAFGIFLVLVVIAQTCNFVYWLLTKLHLTKAYYISTKAILKDLGYTMDQYLSDSYTRYVVTQEFISRLKR